MAAKKKAKRPSRENASLRATAWGAAGLGVGLAALWYGKAIIQGDGDLAVCSLKKQAIVEIVESGNRPWWRSLVPG